MILLTVLLCAVEIFPAFINGNILIPNFNMYNERQKFVEAVKKFNTFNLSATIPQPETEDILKYASGRKNDDTYLTGSEIITKYGYPVEIHLVQTIDGYILKLFRIPCGGPPVFLMHGIISSSDDYIIAGPASAIAFSLAKEGYDVWMGNARGNKYSRAHVTLSPDRDHKFWDFSWNEIGLIDLPSMIDYVLNKTDHKKLMYIGHSQGTTSFFVMCSEKPEYNAKISIMIAMAAVAYLSHIKSPLIRALALFENEEFILSEVLGIHLEVLPDNAIDKTITSILCGNVGLAVLICSNVAFSMFGFDYAQLNITNLPNIAQHATSGSSTKQFLHYIQVINSGKFQKFDYGAIRNMFIYGTSSAPKYRLESVIAPVFIFYSDNDWIADPIDVTMTRNRLPNVVEFYRIPYHKFNHLDYLWGKDLKTLVYDKISKTLEKYRPTTPAVCSSCCPKS